MLNNSTNINMNNHLQSMNLKNPKIYYTGNPGTGLGQAQQCGGV